MDRVLSALTVQETLQLGRRAVRRVSISDRLNVSMLAATMGIGLEAYTLWSERNSSQLDRFMWHIRLEYRAVI